MKFLVSVLLLACAISSPGWCDKIKEKVKAQGKKPGYEITASLPDHANPALKKILQTHIQSFKKDYSTTDYEGGFAWYLTLQWKREFANRDVISYLMLEEMYGGGAHPSHAQVALILSARNQQPIPLARCFKEGTPWLQTMADYCRKKLHDNKDLGPDDIDGGAAPKAENYANVLPGEKGLTVFFQEYQVGPYSAGPQEVLVPYEVLHPYLDPQGPLAGFLR